MVKQRKYSAVIFDLDGLMLDTESISQPAWKRAMMELGYEFDESIFPQIMGLKLEAIGEFYRGLLGQDFPFEKANELRSKYMNEHFEKFGIELKPGLLELLEFLDKNELPKVIATSSQRDFAMLKLRFANLIDRFDMIVCADEVENGKPAPDIFYLAAEKLGVDVKECLVLEDSSNGIKAAHAAGMGAVLVPDINQPTEDILELADRVFPTLNEVIPFLQKGIN